MTQKLTRIGKIPIFLIDPIWLCLTSIQLIGMRLFFFIKELRVDLLNKNSKNGHFPTKNCPKMALYGQNSHFFLFWFNMITLVNKIKKVGWCMGYFNWFHSIWGHRYLNEKPFFPISSSFPAILGFWGHFRGSREKISDF